MTRGAFGVRCARPSSSSSFPPHSTSSSTFCSRLPFSVLVLCRHTLWQPAARCSPSSAFAPPFGACSPLAHASRRPIPLCHSCHLLAVAANLLQTYLPKPASCHGVRMLQLEQNPTSFFLLETASCHPRERERTRDQNSRAFSPPEPTSILLLCILQFPEKREQQERA